MSLKTQIQTHREQCESVMDKHVNIKYIFSHTLILYRGDIQIRRDARQANTMMEDVCTSSVKMCCQFGQMMNETH